MDRDRDFEKSGVRPWDQEVSVLWGRESMRFGVSRTKGTVQNAEVSVSWSYVQGLN